MTPHERLASLPLPAAFAAQAAISVGARVVCPARTHVGQVDGIVEIRDVPEALCGVLGTNGFVRTSGPDGDRWLYKPACRVHVSALNGRPAGDGSACDPVLTFEQAMRLVPTVSPDGFSIMIEAGQYAPSSCGGLIGAVGAQWTGAAKVIRPKRGTP